MRGRETTEEDGEMKLGYERVRLGGGGASGGRRWKSGGGEREDQVWRDRVAEDGKNGIEHYMSNLALIFGYFTQNYIDKMWHFTQRVTHRSSI